MPEAQRGQWADWCQLIISGGVRRLILDEAGNWERSLLIVFSKGEPANSAGWGQHTPRRAASGFFFNQAFPDPQAISILRLIENLSSVVLYLRSRFLSMTIISISVWETLKDVHLAFYRVLKNYKSSSSKIFFYIKTWHLTGNNINTTNPVHRESRSQSFEVSTGNIFPVAATKGSICFVRLDN